MQALPLLTTRPVCSADKASSRLLRSNFIRSWDGMLPTSKTCMTTGTLAMSPLRVADHPRSFDTMTSQQRGFQSFLLGHLFCLCIYKTVSSGYANTTQNNAWWICNIDSSLVYSWISLDQHSNTNFKHRSSIFCTGLCFEDFWRLHTYIHMRARAHTHTHARAYTLTSVRASTTA